MIDLLTATATELLVQLRERRVSSRELVDGYLDRIARLNAPWNAVVTLDAERARARADELDHARTRGEDRGPLHGLPMTIKDAYEIAGLRTVAGATEYAEHVPSRTAVAVQRLLDAGAIVLGKTNVPAYCADVQTFNEVFGVTKNPHDATRTPGGSSGGAAVAIACGFTALELGSDIGGSIRTPSGWTGVYGHKPSFGVVPPRGHVPPAPGALADFDLSVCGPMARSAADLELALSVLAGPDEVEARGYGLALPAARHTALRDFRVGVWLDEPAFPLDPEVRACLEAAVLAVERAGARVERVRGQDFGVPIEALYDDYLKLLLPVTLSGTPARSRDTLQRIASGELTGVPEMLVRIARCATQSHIDWLGVHERRAGHRARFEQLFAERFDVLLLPITPVPAIPHDPNGSSATRSISVGAESRPYMDLFGWIAPATACYLPATAAPVGRTRAGLPVGVQIVGRYLDDRTTLAFAKALGAVHGGFLPPPVMTTS